MARQGRDLWADGESRVEAPVVHLLGAGWQAISLGLEEGSLQGVVVPGIRQGELATYLLGLASEEPCQDGAPVRHRPSLPGCYALKELQVSSDVIVGVEFGQHGPWWPSIGVVSLLLPNQRSDCCLELGMAL